MRWLPAGLCLMLLQLQLLDAGPSSLPAPVNLSVDSVNFLHVLRWDPGPGTPPGTQYRISCMEEGELRLLATSNTTSAKLKLETDDHYYLVVQASYNNTLSPASRSKEFMAFRDTKIGPPKLSLAGCGNCIDIKVSLPEADGDANIIDIHDMYDVDYNLSWMKRGGEQERPITFTDKSYTLSNLQSGVEYCVQVKPVIIVNSLTSPSDWQCAFTSIEEPSRGPLIIGTAAAAIVLVAVVMTTVMFLLYRTGFICKLKETLPKALNAVHGCTLTPEKTVLHQVAVIPPREVRRTPNEPGNSEEEEEEEDEDEDEDAESKVYMNRGADLSSGLCSSENSSGSKGSTTAGDSRSVTAVMEAEEEEHGAEGANEALHPQQTGVEPEQEVEEEEEEVEVCDSSGNVDLFSITIGALAASEKEKEGEEEEEEEEELLRQSDVDPLLPTDAHPESADRSAAALSGYEGRGGDSLREEEEDEEEEEEFCAYIRHA